MRRLAPAVLVCAVLVGVASLVAIVATATAPSARGPARGDSSPAAPAGDSRPAVVAIRAFDGAPFVEEDSQKLVVGTTPSHADLEHARAVLAAGLARYGPGLGDSPLSSVVVADGLTYDGESVVGLYRRTAAGHVVYVATRHDSGGIALTDQDLERTLHHEISSMVYLSTVQRDPTFDERWEQLLPDGVAYAEDWRDESAWETYRQDTVYGREHLYRDGFLDPYALTGIENDFNTVAERYFCPDERTRVAMRLSERIRAKVRRVASAYERHDLRFPVPDVRPEPPTAARESGDGELAGDD